ncbi:MAG: acetoacetyl-[acyl-carrier protein] synthase [Flavobacteriales bacterium]|jgi:acetoacetyl-[acyl-carrier protein] synthase
MSSHLPLIVGFGGYNAAGRASGHQAYRRMILDSLGAKDRQQTISSLAHLMKLAPDNESAVLAGTLIRKIGEEHFNPDAASIALNVNVSAKTGEHMRFELSARQMPEHIPDNWQADPIDEEGRRFIITVNDQQAARVDVQTSSQVKAAGQLPTGFTPSEFYRSTHHPRGLQMTVMAASDAIHNVGLDWSAIQDLVDPDQVAVYSSSVMSQLDQSGFGGMMSSRARGQRSTSKQLSLGFTSLPGDFTNAYVLGSLGATGSVTGACATFLYNLRWAVEELRSGRRKIAVVGCSEAPILPEVIDGFAAMSALATDADLCKLDGVGSPDYSRASRPFGENCGFTIGESSQYIVLMADDLALEMGAEIYGAVPGVYVNADGFKKSISAPGPGNYLTMAKAVGLANTLLGADVVRNQSFIQAHGSSTPQNRITESKIFDEVAKAYGISSWPVAAVKSYLGHSLGPASGDQINCSLGVFAHGILPGIKTISGVADDVYSDRLSISNKDQELGVENSKVAFLNSKGFGGNNATATVFSPEVVYGYLSKKHGSKVLKGAAIKREAVVESRDAYLDKANNGELEAIYEFGSKLIDESAIELTDTDIRFPGYSKPVKLNVTEGFGEF